MIIMDHHDYHDSHDYHDYHGLSWKDLCAKEVSSLDRYLWHM